MQWIYRFMMGLPPRPHKNDVELFRETFPEFKSNEEKFREHIKEIPGFFIFYPKKFNKEWFKEEVPETDKGTNFHCKVPGCELAIKNDEVVTPQNEDEILNLVIGTWGHLKENSDINSIVKAIVLELHNSQNVFGDLGILKRALKNVKEAYYIDPYLGKFYLNVAYGEDFINNLKQEIPNLTLITSNIDIKGRESELRESWKWTSKSKFPFHDRFIICRINKDFFGVLIGKSGTGIKKSDDHSVIAKLSKIDAEKLRSIIKKYFSL